MRSPEASLGWRLPILLACAFAFLCGATVLTTGAHAAHRKKESRPEKVSLLYVMNAGRATLLPESGSKTGYRFVVEGAEPYATWFSDRPRRQSGSFPARFLASDWAGFGFVSDPPNVAVDYIDSQGRNRTAMLVLRKPRLHKAKIVFDARLLDPGAIKDPNLASHSASADDTPPRHLRDVSVFVDDSEARVLNGCVLQPGTSCPSADLDSTYLVGADLTGADLQGAFVQGSELNADNLTEADLSEANIDSTIENSTLIGTNLSGAYLGAVISRSNMSGVNLTNANLGQSHFEDVNLSGARTSGLSWGSATFCGTVMPDGSENNSGCNWLE